MNIIEAKQILGVTRVSLSDVENCFSVVSDPVVLEQFKLRKILDNLTDKDCSDEDKLNFKKIISLIEQDMNNKKRDEPFPQALCNLSRIVLSVYSYKPQIVDNETISGFEYTARKILSKSKTIWLRQLPLKQRIEEIENLLYFAMIEEKIILPEYDCCSEADTFGDLGADEGSIFSMVEILQQYLSIIINIAPADDETVNGYAERLALDL